jgi:hypothetical protein
MLKIYDYIEEIIATQEIRDATHHAGLRYYASELLQRLDANLDDQSTHEAIQRSIQVCIAAGIPIKRHFKRVQVFDGRDLHSDWRLSAMAGFLLLMNGAADDPNTAKAQLMVLMHQKII